MAEPTSIGPRSLGATLGAVHARTLGRALEAFGLPAVDYAGGRKVFSFHRHKDRKLGRWGFDVWLWINESGTNLTAYGLSPFHRRLDDARSWAIDFAKAHGFVAMQRGKRPKERPRPKLTLVPFSEPRDPPVDLFSMPGGES